MYSSLKLRATVPLHPPKHFCSHPWSAATLDTHREDSTSELPREAGLATWEAGSPSRGTSCPVIVLAPTGAGRRILLAFCYRACELRPSLFDEHGQWVGGVVTDLTGAGGASQERTAATPLGGPGLSVRRAAPRPTTSETRLPPTGGLCWGILDTDSTRGQAHPGNRAVWGMKGEEVGCHIWK